MNFTYKGIGGGAYEQRRNGKATGKFYHRLWKLVPQPDGSTRKIRTSKLLHTAKTRQQALAQVSMTNPRLATGKFNFLAEVYVASGCMNKRHVPRTGNALTEERRQVEKLQAYFGNFDLDDLHAGLWHGYHLHRTQEIKSARPNTDGHRQVDKELQTMRNIFSFALSQHPRQLYHRHPFAAGCARYQTKDKISPSTDRAPKNADAVHLVAARLLESITTETAGWFTLFAAFSGCRISELLRLRTDALQTAPNRFEAGFRLVVPGDTDGTLPRHFLCLGKRNKHGINPRVVIFAEFAEMLKAFDRWHSERYPDSKWYFPNHDGSQPADRHVIARQIRAAQVALELPAITPHGYRSYFSTKHRSDGMNDAQIAFLMGDKTVRLVNDNYGDTPESWTGGTKLTWLPRKEKVAWQGWLEKVVYERSMAKTAETQNRNRIKAAGVAKWQTHRT